MQFFDRLDAAGELNAFSPRRPVSIRFAEAAVLVALAFMQIAPDELCAAAPFFKAELGLELDGTRSSLPELDRAAQKRERTILLFGRDRRSPSSGSERDGRAASEHCFDGS